LFSRLTQDRLYYRYL